MERRRINSEKKISNDKFKAKIGSTDKKRPSVVYIECGAFIKPVDKLDSYKENITRLYKKMDSAFRNMCVRKNDIFKQDYIRHFELSENSMNEKKSTFLTIQLYLKQSNLIPYKDIVGLLEDEFTVLSKDMSECLTSCGFSHSKTKK